MRSLIDGNKRVLCLVLFSILFLTVACTRDKGKGDITGPVETEIPSIRMAVFSDPHYYDPTLGTTSDSFVVDLARDRKMLVESEAIMEAVTQIMRAQDVEVVLVPGDMTKDGVQQCHEKVAQYLAQIESSGKKVYVVPGNHDIDNPHAYSYPDNSEPVLEGNITAQGFESIYSEFGFAEAKYRDPNSLTYIAEPKKGIWILAMDCCNYQGRFADITLTGGAFTAVTLEWIRSKLAEAAAKEITVFGMMHHGVVEHFPGMDAVFVDYLLRDWQSVATEFAELGLNVVFTGHHHATDISEYESNGSYIIDIQTGSTITWTCPYRLVYYDHEKKEISIDTYLIDQINFDTGSTDFQTFAYDFMATGLPPLVASELGKLGVSPILAGLLEPFVTPTLLAYYRGDEPDYVDEQLISRIQGLAQTGDPMATMLSNLLLGIWYDSTPDNNVFIDLQSGAISKKVGT